MPAFSIPFMLDISGYFPHMMTPPLYSHCSSYCLVVLHCLITDIHIHASIAENTLTHASIEMHTRATHAVTQPNLTQYSFAPFNNMPLHGVKMRWEHSLLKLLGPTLGHPNSSYSNNTFLTPP